MSNKYPNSGSVARALSDFFTKIEKKTKFRDCEPLISILVEIAYKNPRTFPIVVGVLSILLSAIPKGKREDIIKNILDKFSTIPNLGILEIWLQRLTAKYKYRITYQEKLCGVLDNADVSIWNNEWLKPPMKHSIEKCNIIDKSIFDEMTTILSGKEMLLYIRNITSQY
jgi:hypothetical protein